MAKQTNGKDREPQIAIPAPVKAQLVDYQAALARTYNRQATYGEIIGALLWGVPLWQGEAIIAGYRPQYEDCTDTESDDDSG